MKKILSLVLCFMCLVSIVPAQAAENENPGLRSYTTHEPWVHPELGLITYPDPSPVDFPLPYGEVYVEAENSEDRFDGDTGVFWVQLPDGDLASHLQSARPVEVIPDGDLASTSTEELVKLAQTVIPSSDIRMWSVNSYEQHVEGLIWEYNVISELMGREDVTEALFSGYKYGCNYNLLELLMIGDQLLHGEYDSEEKAKMADAFDRAQGLRYAATPSSYLNSGAYNAYVTETGKFPCSFQQINSAARVTIIISYDPYTIVLPNGETVEAWYDRRPDLNAAEVLSNNTVNGAAHPTATRVGEPTRKYNCHSWAWYIQSTGSKYWINDPTPFQSSGNGYVRVYSGYRPGDIIRYTSDDHSAIIQSLLGNNRYRLISKWGEAGLYEHNSDGSPYNMGSFRVYRKA